MKALGLCPPQPDLRSGGRNALSNPDFPKASEGPAVGDDPGQVPRPGTPCYHPRQAWRPDELEQHANKNYCRLCGRTKGDDSSGPLYPRTAPNPSSPGSLPLPSSGTPERNAAPRSRGTLAPGLRPGPRTPRTGISALLAPAPPLPRPALHKGPLSRRIPGLRFLKSYRRKPEEIGKNGERGGGRRVPSKTPRPRRASGAPEKSQAP